MISKTHQASSLKSICVQSWKSLEKLAVLCLLIGSTTSIITSCNDSNKEQDSGADNGVFALTSVTELEPSLESVTASDEYVFVSKGKNGLDIFKTAQDFDLQKLSTINNGSHFIDALFYKNNLLAFDRDYGVNIFSLGDATVPEKINGLQIFQTGRSKIP